MKRILFILFVSGLFLTVNNCIIGAQEREAIAWDDARLYDGTLFGKEIAVEFVVVDSTTKSGVCYLNSHPDWKRYFAAAIFKKDFTKFPPSPEKYYLNKKIRVTGVLKKYFRNKPGIILKSPTQIEVMS